ncbi:hypothetical protein A8135_02045 [Legionella jamestowniensis]|uniref:Uncharacterized protein n=1 Tax=Legionella jamestowniensis TaxID=455 RepID=A0ABX2XTS6_9GAMM|nr:hypothetical protein [Legionella jamestowniensis]OCH98025.1 hypothetical protein A8135_02045 [Legionella jamestowniensis]
MRMFKEKLITQEENPMTLKKRVEFLNNVISVLSRDPSMRDEEKQKILVGSLLYTDLTKEVGLTKNDIIEIIAKP